MTVALVAIGASTGLLATAAAANPTFGATPTANNLLCCWVTGHQSTGASANLPTTPSGWTIAAQVAGSTKATATIFAKIATGGDAAPSIPGVASTVWQAKLGEWSGLSSSSASPDQSGTGGTASTSPVVATAGAVDAAAGELVLWALGMRYSSASATTTTATLNNGLAETNLDHNDGNSTSNHYHEAWGTTTSNASADQCSMAFTVTLALGAALAIASFSLAAVTTTGLPDLTMAPPRR